MGDKLGTHFTERAKHEMRRWFIKMPHQDLAYFPEGSEEPAIHAGPRHLRTFDRRQDPDLHALAPPVSSAVKLDA